MPFTYDKGCFPAQHVSSFSQGISKRNSFSFCTYHLWTAGFMTTIGAFPWDHIHAFPMSSLFHSFLPLFVYGHIHRIFSHQPNIHIEYLENSTFSMHSVDPICCCLSDRRWLNNAFQHSFHSSRADFAIF